jgi:cell division protein FtsQ
VNPWHHARLLNALSNALAALALLGLLSTMVIWFVHRPMFDLRVVEVGPMSGMHLRHAPAALLRHAARRSAQGGFFTVRLDEVRANFEGVPWVRRAAVRRIWPNRLVVEIEEHRPVALWGDEQLLNGFGEVFTANVVEAEEEQPLPMLSGPEGSAAVVMRQFDELKSLLASSNAHPATLELSERRAWTVGLDDGTQLLLGRDQGVPIEERVRRWAAVYPRMRGRLDQKPQVIDLRYPNGFAVRAAGLSLSENATDARKGGVSVASLNNR